MHLLHLQVTQLSVCCALCFQPAVRKLSNPESKTLNFKYLVIVLLLECGCTTHTHMKEQKNLQLVCETQGLVSINSGQTEKSLWRWRGQRPLGVGGRAAFEGT